MAGLQYYFFPTDFYYPRPKPAAGTNAADGNVNVDVDPRTFPSSQPEDGRDNKPEKTTEAVAAAAALVDSDVKSDSKKPRGSLPCKTLVLSPRVLSPREIGEERRRLKAVIADSRNKWDRNV